MFRQAEMRETVMKYASNNIRNILIAGHAGSGR